MVLLKIIQKNFNLLFRTKNSAFVIIFGPLLIILLAGLAFNNSSAYSFNVGVYSSDYNEFVNSYVTQLKDKQFNTFRYKTLEGCVDDIKRGLLHTCVEFPEGFELKPNLTNELIIYADTSNLNIVEIVIDAISAKLETRTTELSEDMAVKLISTLQKTNFRLAEDNNNLMKVTENVNQLSLRVQDIKTKLNALEISFSVESPSEVVSDLDYVNADFEAVKEETLELYQDYKDYVSNYYDDKNESDDFVASLEEKEQDFIDRFESTPERIFAIQSNLNDLSDNINNIDTQFAQIESTHTSVKADLNNLRAFIDEIEPKLEAINASIADSIANIGSVAVQASPDSIASPITTKIESVTTEENRLSFVIHHFIVIVIMFICVLLAAISVVIEKTSRAFFRNFAAPVKDVWYILSIYFTTGLISVMQLMVIVGIGVYYLSLPLLNNFLVSAFLLILIISLFTFIGMLIGYIFISQETATLFSISLSATFLFTSNIMLPIESMSPFMQSFAKLNPYVISTEALRRSILFGADFVSLLPNIGLLLLYSVILFAFVLIVQRLTKVRYFNILASTEVISDYLTELDEIPAHKYFTLKDGTVVKNKVDLINALKKMTNEDYEQYVNLNKNEFSRWIYNVYKDTRLAERIKNKSRIGLIMTLEKDVSKR